MTRPYTRTKQVQTTMRPADVDRLDALADQLGMSRANLIHEAILEKLNDLPRALTWQCCGVSANEPHLPSCYAFPPAQAKPDDELARVERLQKEIRDLRAQREALR